MEPSTSFGDINLRPSSAGIDKRTRTFYAQDPTPKIGGSPSPPPAQLMSDTTESSESTCGRTETSPPSLRRRGSSWSLAKGEKAPEQTRKGQDVDSLQGPRIERPETPSVPQHEAIDRTVSEIQFPSMTPQASEVLLNRLAETSMRGNLTVINLSRRGLGTKDAILVKEAISHCPQISVVKLSYNNFGDEGTATIASAFVSERGHHECLSVLDLGFNNLGEEGCAALALHAVAGNYVLRTLYLSGNFVREKGALSLAGAILHGSGLTCLHLASNQIGTVGVKALTRAIAESETRAQIAAQQGDQAAVAALPTMQKLYLGGTSMKPSGLLSVANMALTNFSLRTLSLSDNGIDDNDMALLAQSVGQNKNMPLEVLELSFNNISCVGIECLMNAVWGLKTLRVMKLDHNRLSDRGAQLAAVVLTSIELEVLDVGYNRIGSLGIKALMKSLSENSSLVSLTLSGIPIDPPASKAVCYALAYNSSLRSFYVDSCSIGYSAQRHIVAGVVSNQHSRLRVFTGFRLGAITVTLGLPEALETLSNDQVLRFVRMMWKWWREHLRESKRAQQLQGPSENGKGPDNDEDLSLGTNPSSDGQRSETRKRNEPADPKTVVSASKHALSQIGDIGGGPLRTEPHQRETVDTSPLVPLNATLLERTASGTVKVPSLLELCEDETDSKGGTKSVNENVENSTSPESSLAGPMLINPVTGRRNIEWLRENLGALNEVAQLPFNENDLWQLQQYYYSLVDGESIGGDSCDSLLAADGEENSGGDVSLGQPQPTVHRSELTPGNGNPEGLTTSDRMPMAAAYANISTSKRHSWEVNDDNDDDDDMEPATKRAKSSEVRIARYPRVWEKMESYRALNAQDRVLALMRQLKFVESGILLARNRETGDVTVSDTDLPTHHDVEMILMSLEK